MKTTRLLTTLTLSMLTLSASSQDYELVWSDEFNSNTLGINWNVEVVSNPSNNELQYYTNCPSNVRIENGNLILTARRERYQDKDFTSGRVNSSGKIAFTHGIIEARIKLPRLANGLWPAFWMMGEEPSPAQWPACGEIDILEAGHSDGIKHNTQERLFSGCIHWGTTQDNHQMWTTGATTNSYDITGDYHIFKAVWDEEHLFFYLDNSAVPYYKASIGKPYERSSFFHKPFHILFNLAVGGDYPMIHNKKEITALSEIGMTAEMYVDYVRVYQKKDAKNLTQVQNSKKIKFLPHPSVPQHAAANVISIYGSHYKRAGDGDFDTWSCPGEGLSYIRVEEGGRARKIKNFRYVGLNIWRNFEVIDVSKMTHLHADIYTEKSTTIGMTPISKDLLDDYTNNGEYIIRFQLKPGWNSINVPLSDYTRKCSKLNLSRIHQMKWDGGDGQSDIYIDNLFFFQKE